MLFLVLELRKLRSDACVLLCSGYDEHEMAERFEGLGMAGFVHKPFDMVGLKSKLEQVLAAR